MLPGLLYLLRAVGLDQQRHAAVQAGSHRGQVGTVVFGVCNQRCHDHEVHGSVELHHAGSVELQPPGTGSVEQHEIYRFRMSRKEKALRKR